MLTYQRLYKSVHLPQRFSKARLHLHAGQQLHFDLAQSLREIPAKLEMEDFPHKERHGIVMYCVFPIETSIWVWVKTLYPW